MAALFSVGQKQAENPRKRTYNASSVCECTGRVYSPCMFCLMKRDGSPTLSCWVARVRGEESLGLSLPGGGSATHVKQKYENPNPSLTKDNPNVLADYLKACADTLTCRAERLSGCQSGKN